MSSFPRAFWIAVGVMTATACRSPLASLELEQRTPAAEHGQLTEDIGIETAVLLRRIDR